MRVPQCARVREWRDRWWVCWTPTIPPFSILPLHEVSLSSAGEWQAFARARA